MLGYSCLWCLRYIVALLVAVQAVCCFKGNQLLAFQPLGVDGEGDFLLAVSLPRLEWFAGHCDLITVFHQRIAAVLDHQGSGHNIPLGSIQSLVFDSVDQSGLR